METAAAVQVLVVAVFILVEEPVGPVQIRMANHLYLVD